MNNVFDVIKNFTSIKNKNDLGTDLYFPYIVNRFLTMKKIIFFMDLY